MRRTVPPGTEPDPPPPAPSPDDGGDGGLAQGFFLAALADRTDALEDPWDAALSALEDGLRGKLTPVVARLARDAPAAGGRRQRLAGALRALARAQEPAPAARWPLPASVLRPGWQPPPGLREAIAADDVAAPPAGPWA